MPLFIIALSTLEVNDFQPMGITPAYAGKSSIYTSSVSVFTDHPRLCGEKFRFCHVVIVKRGSPPPMRGKAVVKIVAKPVTRITPAYAGKRNPRVVVM